MMILALKSCGRLLAALDSSQVTDADGSIANEDKGSARIGLLPVVSRTSTR